MRRVPITIVPPRQAHVLMGLNADGCIVGNAVRRFDGAGWRILSHGPELAQTYRQEADDPRAARRALAKLGATDIYPLKGLPKNARTKDEGTAP